VGTDYFQQPISTFKFEATGKEATNFTDQEFLDVIEKGKKHCYRGDVFQIVLSRRFSNAFKGDEFNVYRALRSINPSPNLFYFDYGSFKIFGSSPEAQLQVNKSHAYIYPIAARLEEVAMTWRMLHWLLNFSRRKGECRARDAG